MGQLGDPGKTRFGAIAVGNESLQLGGTGNERDSRGGPVPPPRTQPPIWLIVMASGGIPAKLLFWLAALAMPFQTSWAAHCGCSSATPPAASTVAGKTPPACRCRAAATKRSCCNLASDSTLRGGCRCGPHCRCVRRDQSPTQPAAPAPLGARSRSVVPLALSPSAVAGSTAAGGAADTLAWDSFPAFSEPGTQVCVLLCRFML